MKTELSLRIAGEAGQGMQTIGTALCKIFTKAGFFIFANQDYMSRIRGGNNFFLLRVSTAPVYTLRQKSDIIVALDKESVALHREGLNPGGIIVLDEKKFNVAAGDNRYLNVPFYGIAREIGGNEIYSNSVTCGFLAGVTGISCALVKEILKATFSKKSEEVIRKNLEAVEAGCDFARKHFTGDAFRLAKGKTTEHILINGNEAIALGAIRAGCTFYSAYPMTPATSIMTTMAHFADRFGILVEQAEDEIAAINMAIGASFAGARAMTATSGGGFALMTEGMSLAAITETPVVVVDSQRPGPATGLPTRTEQADLDFLLHGGHGEWAKVLFSPGTAEQAFFLTIRAFELAEKYQVPVLIMTDQYLADTIRNIAPFDTDRVAVRRHIISKEDSAGITDYKRYRLTDSGISPRAIPSWINDVIYADSDEHTEEGHITESAAVRKTMVNKRFLRRMELLANETEEPTTHNLKGADIILVGYGSTYGTLKEVSEIFDEKRIGMVHFSQVWPFPVAATRKLLEGASCVMTVENNAGAQLARLIRRETGMTIGRSILRYDGRPFNLDYLTERIKKFYKPSAISSQLSTAEG
ncbi:MAG: 2-oxoacid:acceptor oxidoreductase subunit alpha [Candidatus Omnitrophica bacterium]|nr:2-oxoacid:acceptor oxidoreductase subunit alpha [Candidatus Omnitrophota bacterium]